MITNTSVIAQHVGTQRQLFLDDWGVRRLDGIRRTLHQPAKVPECPVLQVDRPWEQGALASHGDKDTFVTFNGTVIDDAEDKIMKMWYEAYPGLVLYAVSEDGVHWEKTILNAVEWDGSRRNNIVINTGRAGGTTVSVHKDETETDPMRRYKTMYGAGPIPLTPGRPEPKIQGANVAFSPDGIHWEAHPNNPVWPYRPLGPNDSLRMVYDPYKKRFACYDKIHRNVNGRWRRVIGLGYSDDFVTWTNPEPVLLPDEQDSYDDDFYGLTVLAYAGIYLGYLWVFHTNPQSKMAGEIRMDGATDIQLATSRDGVHWQRVADRSVFIPLGETGSYEAGQIATPTNSTPIIRNDEIYIYYSGLGGRLVINSSGINLAKLRLDGYVSLDAGPDGGVIETAPLTVCGQKLVINADASEGEVTVEICTPEGQPLPGLDLAHCDTFRGNSVRHTVRWQQRPGVADLAGQPAVLRFHLKNARLYSYRFSS